MAAIHDTGKVSFQAFRFLVGGSLPGSSEVGWFCLFESGLLVSESLGKHLCTDLIRTDSTDWFIQFNHNRCH